MHCSETSETGEAPHLEEILTLIARFKPPPERQPSRFNCWIRLGWCGNLLRSPPYFHDLCMWQFACGSLYSLQFKFAPFILQC